MGENISPANVAKLLKELHSLQATPLPHIRVLIDEADVTNVQADIDGPESTPYAGGTFRIRLRLGPEYPNAPPRGHFLTKVFHPNVSEKGEICVNTLKKDWDASLGLRHVLVVIRCLLIEPFAESALNEEAGRLILEDFDAYCKQAKMMTEVHARAVGAPAGKVAAVAEKGKEAKKPKKIAKKKSLKRL